MNTEPLPGSLVTVTSPPIRRASLRVMARPSPVAAKQPPLLPLSPLPFTVASICYRTRGATFGMGIGHFWSEFVPTEPRSRVPQ